MKLILLCCSAIALMLIPYIYGDEWDRWSFGEGNVAHMKQNTGYWKSEKEKTKFIWIYAFWHLLLVSIIVGALCGCFNHINQFREVRKMVEVIA